LITSHSSQNHCLWRRGLFFTAAVHGAKFGGVLRQKVVRVCDWRQNTERLLVMVVRRRKRGCLGRVGGLGGGVCKSIIFLPLHAPVLEPDLDLSLCQTELVCDLYASAACEVAVVVKLLLQFQRLMPCV